MRLGVVLSCLLICFVFSSSLSFAQDDRSLPDTPPVDESVRLQALSLLDAGVSGVEREATDPDSLASDEDSDPGQKGSGTAPGRSKPGAGTSGTPAVATTYVFPTSGEMNRYWLKNTLGPKAFAGAAFTASWNQWVTDSPSEWSKDATGWFQRYGSSLLDNGINTTSLVWISRAMGQDPRYIRCDCTGFWPRTRHAIVLAFTAPNRNGDLKFSPAKIVAPFTGPSVTRNTIYPDRFGFGDVFSGGAYYVAGSIGWNWVREFILRKW
jgi:hypothetical protein